MARPEYYITTAIAYASSKPHIGNTYEAIMSDSVARYRRARGFDVFFCTGTDEHGQKIQNYAEKAGQDPQTYVDGVSGVIKKLWDGMNVSYDRFIRTTEPGHEKAVQKIFERFLRQGDIYKGYYEGWYCTPCEAFFTDTQAAGGICPDCGAPVKKAREEAYFFNMQKYAPRLISHIESHPGFIEPEARKNEMLNNFLIPGLQDLCVSRTSFSWGIKVPSDPKHVVYVWLDALSNYITALGYDPDLDFDSQPELFRKYWPADIHVIGKDILRFHTIYWPIFLMALGLPLPEKVFGHPWFNFGTEKMSKSKGNVIYADRMADFVGVDGVRYYALAEMPYASDGSATWENVFKRYNNDLVNNLGNLVKRTLDMQKKYFDRVIQAPSAPAPLDDELRQACLRARDEMFAAMDSCRVADALAAVFRMLDRANKYIDETTPWVLARSEADRERLGTVLYTLLSAIRWGALLLHPFIPVSSDSILSQLGLPSAGGEPLYDALLRDCDLDALRPGDSVGESSVLFARVDETALMKQIIAEREAARKAAEAAAKAQEQSGAKPAAKDAAELISFESFMKTDLRSAKILSAEPVPGSKKLLKLTVDIGGEQRQIVSGIAAYYAPADLCGRTVIVVANLAPAKLCGVESRGMLLACGEDPVRVVFLPDGTPTGLRIR
jgi:methionyl-tRNA synthetase